MELDIHKIHIVHKKGGDKIWRIFDNIEEALKCSEIGNKFGGDLAVDPLYAFLVQTKARAELQKEINL